jgi:aspartyl-tRNA(Asn)/glutamyl-tRNA(Gln) amidotransferase subunit C
MDTDAVKKTANLANIKLKDSRLKKIADNLKDIIGYIDLLQKADVKDLPDSFNASGLKNITVDEEIKKQDNLTQKQALKNAKRSYKGYVQVEKVI